MEHDWYTSELETVQTAKKSTYDHMRHGATLVMLLAVMLSMSVPVWQSAVNRALEVEYRSLSSSIQQLQEQERLLQSRIAQQTMPEALSESAWREDILLEQIDAETVVRVGRSI